MKKKAVFLDRDGNINRDVGYPHSFDMIEIFSYSFEAVRSINAADLLAVIITNQSGIGRGLIREDDLKVINDKMRRAFAQENAHIDGIYYCPHYLESEIPRYRKDCSCRKPLPGMGLQAAADLDIDLSRSYMVGDKVEDIQFGINIKAKPILVLTGYGEKSREILRDRVIQPAYIAQDLGEAARWILKQETCPG